MYKSNLLFIILVIIYPLLLAGQNLDQLYSLYEDKKFEDLKNELSKLDEKLTSSSDIKFLKTLFIEDGEAALKIFESLSENSNGILRYYVSQKISEYYYARGFYVKAAEWQSVMNEAAHFRAASTLKKSEFQIQVGAFGLKENAYRLQNYLESNRIRSEIIRRDVDDKELYCVWIQGKADRILTEKYAEELKSKLRLNYQIVQP